MVVPIPEIREHLSALQNTESRHLLHWVVAQSECFAPWAMRDCMQRLSITPTGHPSANFPQTFPHRVLRPPLRQQHQRRRPQGMWTSQAYPPLPRRYKGVLPSRPK
jgi:hypothetical protein